MKPIPILHVITGLNLGGAETALQRLLAALPQAEFPATVVSLLPGGPVKARIEAIGVPVHSLGMPRAIPSPPGAFRLLRLVRQLRPAILQGWMYHGNLAAWFSRSASEARLPIAWNVRQTIYDLGRERPGTRLAIHVGALVSSRADSIVYNSEVSRRQHEAIGYHSASATVIPNGFDCQEFRPRPDAARMLRSELRLPEDCLLVGMVCRYHPMKGHDVLFEAARQVLDRGANAAFICIGKDVVAGNDRLAQPLARLGLGAHVHLLGERYDTPELFSGFDVYCSASRWGEGFPNAVGEALASGTPCVVTDVGDSALLVGSSGAVVPGDNPKALADALLHVLHESPASRRARGAEGRGRIEQHFSVARMRDHYAALYRGLAAS